MNEGTTIGIIALEIDKKNQNFEICDYLIDKNYQHRGLGTQGIKLAIDYLTKKGARIIKINFKSSNKIAQKTYESCGFNSVGVDFLVYMRYEVNKKE